MIFGPFEFLKKTTARCFDTYWDSSVVFVIFADAVHKLVISELEVKLMLNMLLKDVEGGFLPGLVCQGLTANNHIHPFTGFSKTAYIKRSYTDLTRTIAIALRACCILLRIFLDKCQSQNGLYCGGLRHLSWEEVHESIVIWSSVPQWNNFAYHLSLLGSGVSPRCLGCLWFLTRATELIASKRSCFRRSALF